MLHEGFFYAFWPLFVANIPELGWLTGASDSREDCGDGLRGR